MVKEYRIVTAQAGIGAALTHVENQVNQLAAKGFVVAGLSTGMEQKATRSPQHRVVYTIIMEREKPSAPERSESPPWMTPLQKSD